MAKSSSLMKFSFLFILLLVQIGTFISVQQGKADMNIKNGDIFQFHVEKMRNIDDETFLYSNNDLDIAFTEGSNITVEVLEIYEQFENPRVRNKIVVDDTYIYENTLLDEYIFANKNWDDLEEEYSPPVFESYETKYVWGLRSYTSGELQIEFVKKDGVLHFFYAKNYTLINSIGIHEIQIQRTDVELGGFNWVTLVPNFIFVFGLISYITRKKKTQNK